MKKLMFALTLISMTSAYGMQNDPIIIKFPVPEEDGEFDINRFPGSNGSEFYRFFLSEDLHEYLYVVGREKIEGGWAYWFNKSKGKDTLHKGEGIEQASLEDYFNEIKKKYEQEELRKHSSVKMGNNDTEKS